MVDVCLGPEEMSISDIENTIKMIDENWDDFTEREKRIWGGRREGFVKILKEAAENGSYSSGYVRV